MGVDVIGLSFVQSAADVVAARRAAAAAGAPDLPIIAKIEKPNAVTRARRDPARWRTGSWWRAAISASRCRSRRLPAIQRQIIKAARRRGVPVILATQVLESMRTETRPTRAEVTDAAHAVDEGVDAIMLAGETAVRPLSRSRGGDARHDHPRGRTRRGSDGASAGRTDLRPRADAGAPRRAVRGRGRAGLARRRGRDCRADRGRPDGASCSRHFGRTP